MKDSKIEWCDHTFNPWEGCTKVSPGCAHCYAEARNHRFGNDNWGPGKPRRRMSNEYWKHPLQWERRAARDQYELNKTGKVTNEDGIEIEWHRPRVFCASLADWLDDEVPVSWLFDLLCLIARTPNLDWLLLTKRPENLRARMALILRNVPRTGITLSHALGLALAEAFVRGIKIILHNIWLGVSVENQEMADTRIPELLEIPAKVRFLSCEPILGSIDLAKWLTRRSDGAIMCRYCCWGDRCDDPTHFYRTDCPHCKGTGILPKIDWVICGGESGPKARAMHPDWARSLRDQCQVAGMPFFFKQWGGNLPFDKVTTNEQRAAFSKMHGKVLAGRLLDGREWNEFPG